MAVSDIFKPTNDTFRIDYLKIYDKYGNDINWNNNPLPEIEIKIESDLGKNANIIPLTNIEGYLVDTFCINNGYMYDGSNRFFINYSNNPSMNIELIDGNNCNIQYVDNKIYNPNLTLTKGIQKISFNLPDNYVYDFPSYTNACSIFLKPISCGLVETESLYLFFADPSNKNILTRPYDANNGTLVFMFYSNDEQETIRFFDVDENKQEIIWTDILEYDMSTMNVSEPITVNIGFKSNEEGVFESTIKVFYKDVNEELYLLGDILVNAEAIGQDERFKSLSENMGLYDTNSIYNIFKEADINEILPDYTLTNEKSKLLLLEYQNIIPFIGTYKALINAVKWLGYDDIYFREWFRNIDITDKSFNKLITYKVPFNAKDRKDTILQFTSNDRIKKLRKLNALSLVYCLNRETDEIDEWGNPETVNCYSYSIDEILVKLYALKKWLEDNIIGVNTKIIDIMGEGVYFERFENNIYSTNNIGYNIDNIIPFTVDAIGIENELVNGQSYIDLTLMELQNARIDLLQYKFEDSIKYVWNSSTNDFIEITDIETLSQDPNNVLVGNTCNFPIKDLQDVRYRINTEKNTSVIHKYTYNVPLMIYDNRLLFYNRNDKLAKFNSIDNKIFLYLERANLINISNDNWEIEYEIGYDSNIDKYYIKNISNNNISYYSSTVNILLNESDSSLYYERRPEYNNVPMLKIDYIKSKYEQYDIDNKTYILDIIDGTISLNNIEDDNNIIEYIDFTYDFSLYEQLITYRTELISPRQTLCIYDPSIYFHNGASDPRVLQIDNSIYRMITNHIGKYDIEAIGWDGYNNIYYDNSYNRFNIWMQSPNIYNYYENNKGNYNYRDLCIATDQQPIYPLQYPLEGLNINKDNNNKYYITFPSISYAIDTIENNSIINLYNLTESIINIYDLSANKLLVDPDYINFSIGDKVSLHLYNTNNYTISKTFETTINAIDIDISSGFYIFTLQNFKEYISIINTHEILYIKNLTSKLVNNIINNDNTFNFNVDSSIVCFNVTQLIALDICDINSNKVLWSGSYRISDISSTLNNTIVTVLGLFPTQFMSGYNIKVRPAYYNSLNYQFKVKESREYNGNNIIYLDDKYFITNFLDSTFSILPYAFDHLYVNNWWQDASLSENIKYIDNSTNIIIDKSTRIILKSIFDVSAEILNQRNIWTIKDNSTNNIIMIVQNNNVPFMFSTAGIYNVYCESYDFYGNLIKVNKEGFITVK